MFNQFTLIAGGIAILIICGLSFGLYKSVKSNGALQVQITQVEDANKLLKENSEKLKKTINLMDQTIQDRDKQVTSLENKYNNITDNLGKDSDDQAPESTKELFRRLRK
jgi:uncharacterized phage infection (PIP) family protein YhgE